MTKAKCQVMSAKFTGSRLRLCVKWGMKAEDGDPRWSQLDITHNQQFLKAAIPVYLLESGYNRKLLPDTKSWQERILFVDWNISEHLATFNSHPHFYFVTIFLTFVYLLKILISHFILPFVFCACRRMNYSNCLT